MMFNKLLIFMFLPVISSLLFSCSMSSCSNDYNLDIIEFNNVLKEELQNVEILGYKKNGRFDEVIDDSYEIVSYNYEKYGIFAHEGILNKPINTNLDYKVIFGDIKDSCLITGILVKEVLCSNSMFNKKFSYSFEEYIMNDDLFACQVIKAFPKRSE